MKHFNFVFILLFSLNLLAQDVEQFAVIAYGTNGAYEKFDCTEHKQYILISEPVAIPGHNQGVKWDLSYKFIEYLYDNHKDDLDLIKGLTKSSWMKYFYGKTQEEAISKAERFGIYKETSSFCGTKSSWGKMNVIKYNDFEYTSDTKLSNERRDFLVDYLENE